MPNRLHRWNPFIIAAVLIVAVPLAIAAFPPEKPYDPRPLMPEAVKKADPNNYTFLVLGDTRGNAVFKLLMEKAMTHKPSFALLTGDQVRDGLDKEYDSLDGQFAPFARTMPLWPCYGNHDARNPANYEKFFGMTDKRYSFDFHNARFIGVESLSNAAAIEKPELEWLEKQLDEGKKAGKLLFVWMHGPAYSVGEKMEITNQPCDFTRLCVKYGVTAVFAGHDHIYYRTKRDGVTHMIQGVAGAPIYTIKRKSFAQRDDVWWGGTGKKQWTLYTPAGGEQVMNIHMFLFTTITVQGGKVSGKTLTHDNQPIDEFVLREGK
ncbi:MAG: metallophosphoesterase [Planctomycetaceae bacterium]|nr:metallophosphoesterase [Planctomycetaceae bacterium]